MSNGHLVCSFILRPLNYHSNLSLPSNHKSSINDMPNLLKTFQIVFQHDNELLCTNIYAIFSILMICFFLLPLVAKQLEILSYQQRSVA